MKESEKKLNKHSSVYTPPNTNSLKLKTGGDNKYRGKKPPVCLIDYTKIKNKQKFDECVQLIKTLSEKDKREDCFRKLNQLRDKVPQMASLLWHSTGTIAILLQEIISIYPYLNNAKLTQQTIEKVRDVLGLFLQIALD